MSMQETLYQIYTLLREASKQAEQDPAMTYSEINMLNASATEIFAVARRMNLSFDERERLDREDQDAADADEMFGVFDE